MERLLGFAMRFSFVRPVILCSLVLAAFPTAIGADGEREATSRPRVKATVPRLLNPGFEKGKPGHPPPGWLNGGAWAGYPATINDRARSGHSCALLQSDPKSLVRKHGTLTQLIDPKNLLGKLVRIRLSARAALNGSESRAYLFCRVDRGPGDTAVFTQAPISESDWQEYQVAVPIARDAINMEIGVMLIGEGKVWVDDAAIELVREAVDFP